MKIILKLDIKYLGIKNDIIDVKPGYARNYLIPKKMAIVATLSNIKNIKENIRHSKDRDVRIYENAQKIIDKINKINLKIFIKKSEKDKIFGSVTTVQVLDALKSYDISLNKKNIILNDPIKTIGFHKVKLNLHSNIIYYLNFEVI